MNLTGKHEKVIKELIKNPRASDTQVSKNTGIPIKTVNRLRQQLEKENIINYYVNVNHSSSGTGRMNAKSMVIIRFRKGITRSLFIERFMNSHIFGLKAEHILFSFLGESEMQLELIMILESRVREDLLEIFNADLVPSLNGVFGDGCIDDVQEMPLSSPLRLFKNYIPLKNYEDGRIKQGWSSDDILI